MKFSKNGFPENWSLISRMFAYPNECSIKSEDYDLDNTIPKKEHYFSKLKTDYLDDSEMEQTGKLWKLLTLKMDEIFTSIFKK